jgi:hypothetical protein
MSRHLFISALLVSAMMASVAFPRPAIATQPATNAMAATFQDFNRRIAAYVELHARLAKETGPIDETKQPAEITAREVALGTAVRQARANAKVGDIMAPPIAAAFKAVIANEYKRRSPQVKTDRKEDQDELADFVPQVNQVYPPTQPLVTFPVGLLKTLPKLPKELEYRLVQRYLILRDIEANIIIEVLPMAVPR